MPKKSKNPQSKTLKQQNLLKLISERFGNFKDKRTMYELMLKAGYSETSAKQQSEILAHIKPELKTIVDRLKDERDKALKEARKKRKTAQYHQLISAADVLTKNAQLLGGKATENIIYKWKEYSDEKDN